MSEKINVGRIVRIRNAYQSVAGTIHYFGRVERAPVAGVAPLYVVTLHKSAPGEDARAVPTAFRRARWPVTNHPLSVRFRESEIEPIDDAALAAETEAMPAQE
jgi:hypothetical protein